MMPVRIGDATLYLGDVLAVLAGLPSESVHCVVTSPPYWGLRDYGTVDSEKVREAEKQFSLFDSPRFSDDPDLRKEWIEMIDESISPGAQGSHE
jgi:DNA modification methylase